MNSLVRAVVRLCTATGTPCRAMLRARFAPMTAKPVTPMRLSRCPDDSLASSLMTANLQLGDRRDDLPTEDLQRLDLVHARHPTVRLADAQLREPLELRQALAALLALLARVEAEHDGLLDLVVVAADVGAVPAQHVQLVLEVRAGEQVAGVGVLGDHPQRLLLPAAADEDPRARPLQGLRHVQRAPEPVVLALVGGVGVAPHLQ